MDFSKIRKSKNPLSKEFNSPYQMTLQFSERIKLRKKLKSPEAFIDITDHKNEEHKNKTQDSPSQSQGENENFEIVQHPKRIKVKPNFSINELSESKHENNSFYHQPNNAPFHKY